MDVIPAIHNMKKELSNIKPYKHMYGHQDTRKVKEKLGSEKRKGTIIECQPEQITKKEDK